MSEAGWDGCDVWLHHQDGSRVIGAYTYARGGGARGVRASSHV